MALPLTALLLLPLLLMLAAAAAARSRLQQRLRPWRRSSERPSGRNGWLAQLWSRAACGRMVAAHTSSPPSPATGQRQVPDALAASESSRVCVLPSQEADLAQERVAALAAAAGREDELESESEGEQTESSDDADHMRE